MVFYTTIHPHFVNIDGFDLNDALSFDVFVAFVTVCNLFMEFRCRLPKQQPPFSMSVFNTIPAVHLTIPNFYAKTAPLSEQYH